MRLIVHVSITIFFARCRLCTVGYSITSFALQSRINFHVWLCVSQQLFPEFILDFFCFIVLELSFTRGLSIHLAVSLELDLFLLCRFQSVFIEFFDFERKNCSQLQLYSTVQRIFLDCVVSFNNMEQEIGKMLVFLAHEKFSLIRTAFPTFLCTSAV